MKEEASSGRTKGDGRPEPQWQGGKRRVIQTDRDPTSGISITLETRLGLSRILSIHVAPSITHLIERNARNRQLDSVRYIIRPPASDIDIPGA